MGEAREPGGAVRAVAPTCEVLERLLSRWSGVEAQQRRRVVANALALIRNGSDDDVVELQAIVAELGPLTTSTLQEELLEALDVGVRRPLTTALVRRLGGLAWGPAARTPGSLTHDSPELGSLCAEASLRLVMVEDGDGEVGELDLGDVDELLAVFRNGDVPLWRSLVARALADPWGGDLESHLALLDPQRWPGESASIRALADAARVLAEENERRTVAAHIRRTIAATGLSQREFADLLGTSRSRLSTYMSGAVTPSATMMLRINRMARQAQTPDFETEAESY